MDLKFLEKLCGIKGASSEEVNVANIIVEEIKDYIDDYKIDSLGNLIAHKKGNGPKIMLAGHMDQIGMMVRHITEEGFLFFTNIGGLTPSIILGCRVVFDDGTTGVVYNERLEQGESLTIDKMYIDIGVKSREEAEKYVSVGDIAVYYEKPLVDERKIITPCLDDRVGCFIMTETLKVLQDSKFDVYAVFTVQEEVGLRGAIASAYSVDPDYGLAFDVTIAYDTPKAMNFPQKMGEGACIKLKDASLICDKVIVEHLKKCATTNNIKHQFEILTAGGTDSGAIQKTRNGVPSGVISVPSRYVHSMNEMAYLSDISDCIDLTVKFLETSI